MKIPSRGYGARRRLFRISPALVAAIVLLLAIGALFATGVLNRDRLGLGGVKGPDTRGMIAIPVSAGAIPKYTKLSRDHLVNPGTGTLSLLYLRPNEVSPEMIRTLDRIIGRVLDHDKPRGYIFTESDFLPPGTRPGLVAGIPPGKRAMRVLADKVAGLIGLLPGDRFDLVSTITIDPGGRGGNGLVVPGPYSQQLDLQARMTNWQKQANVRVLVQNGLVVEPMTTRQVPVASNTMTNGLVIRTKPVQEVVIAVEPEEVAHLTEALAVNAEISCVPRSGNPDDPQDSVTPGLRPWSPYSGSPAAFGSPTSASPSTVPGATGPLSPGPLTTIETISGSKREMVAIPVKR